MGIPGQECAPLLGVHQAEGVHAPQIGQAGAATLGHPTQQHLGVAAAPEPFALGLQPLAQVGVVVDLAVEHQLPAAAGGGHRLVAAGGEIEDGQTGLHQAGGGVLPGACIVGAPVGNGGPHPLGEGARLGAEQARDAAHQFASIWGMATWGQVAFSWRLKVARAAAVLA